MGVGGWGAGSTWSREGTDLEVDARGDTHGTVYVVVRSDKVWNVRGCEK